MERRELEYEDHKSDKFWTIELDGAQHTVHYGRSGTAGQRRTKDFASEAAARKDFDKLVASKLKKGYVQTGTASAPSTAPAKPAPKPAAKPEPAPKPAAAPAPEPEPEPVELDFEESLGLTWCDHAWAAWKPMPPKPAQQEPPPFDPADCAARLSEVPHTTYDPWGWDVVEIRPPISDYEALFWLRAMFATAHQHEPPRKVAKELIAQPYSPADLPAGGDVLAKVGTAPWSMRLPEATLVVSRFASREQILDWLFDEGCLVKTRWFTKDPRHTLLHGVAPYVVALLSPDERQQLVDRVRAALVGKAWPTGQAPPHPALVLAAALGLHDEIEALAATVPDGEYAGTEDYAEHYQMPQVLLFGLGSATRLEEEFGRLRLHLTDAWHVRAWLAHTGTGSLDLVRRSVARAGKRASAANLLRPLTRVVSPRVAPVMLDLVRSSKAPSMARQWLFDHPAATTLGLAPLVGRSSQAGQDALKLLRSLKKRVGGEAMEACEARLPDDVAARLRALVIDHTEKVLPFFDTPPAWLAEGLAAIEALPARSRKAPKWIGVADLPAIEAEGHHLTDDQRTTLVIALSKSSLEDPAPLVAGLKEHGLAADLEEFAWTLFEGWLAEGAPSKEKWAMLAAGHFGGDASALKLTPMVRAWPGESQHKRAVLGLEVLQAIGTDTALMQLNGIAQKLKFKGLKKKAGEAMEAIAKAMGLTREELADRIVPDCGLDDHGRRSFDFGPRRFEFLLTHEMKAMVRGPDGRARVNLPKPNSKDDAEVAAAAIADWKVLKKQIKQVATLQAQRLEQAMVTGRRWTPEQFRTFFVEHPLMRHLARMLVWGTWDDAGGLAGTFRLTEEGDLADVEDEEHPAPEGRVGIVHPMQLGEELSAAWAELFGDYEIIPPFAQLGRPVRTLEPGDADQRTLTRYAHLKLAAATLVGTLERLGWNRGEAQDGGVFFEHSKAFESAGVTAVVHYDGVPMGYMVDWEDQSPEEVFFLNEVVHETYYVSSYDRKHLAKLGTVDPIVMSEVLSDLEILAGKAKNA